MTDPQDPFAPPPPGQQQPPANPYGSEPPPYGAPAPPPYGAPEHGAPQYGAPLGAPRRNGMGTAALVLGIVSVIPCFWMLAIPGILGVVFGLQGRKRARLGQATNGGAATAGLVTGIISLVLGGLLWVYIGSNLSHFRDWIDCLDSAAGDSVAEESCNDQLTRDLNLE